MELGGGMTCVKYLLYMFNLIFVLSGIAIIALGTYVYINAGEYGIFLGDKPFLSGPVLLIIIGCIVFVVAFFGCCGAARESHCMVMTFAVLLFIIFAVELTAGILGFVYKKEVENVLKKGMNESLKKYEEKSKDHVVVWDKMQKEFKCCGINGPSDWQPPTQLPKSCCKSEIVCTVANAYTSGCYDSVQKFLENKIVIVGGIGIGIAFIEILGIIFACCLAAALRKGGV